MSLSIKNFIAMKKIALIFANLLMLSTVAVYAANNDSTDEKEPSVAFKMSTVSGPEKESVNAFTVTYSYPAKDMEAAIIDRLAKEGIKGKKAKNNFYAFKGVKYNHLWSRTCDFYVAVNGSKTSGTIYLVISTGYDNYIIDDDAEQNKAVSKWLTELESDIKNYIHNNKIAEQEKVVNDADKEVDKLKKEKSKIEKNIEKNEAAIKAFEASRMIPDQSNPNAIDTKTLEKEQKQSQKLTDQQKKLEYQLDEINKKIDNAENEYSKHKNKLKELKTNRP